MQRNSKRKLETQSATKLLETVRDSEGNEIQRNSERPGVQRQFKKKEEIRSATKFKEQRRESERNEMQSHGKRFGVQRTSMKQEKRRSATQLEEPGIDSEPKAILTKNEETWSAEKFKGQGRDSERKDHSINSERFGMRRNSSKINESRCALKLNGNSSVS